MLCGYGGGGVVLWREALAWDGVGSLLSGDCHAARVYVLYLVFNRRVCVLCTILRPSYKCNEVCMCRSTRTWVRKDNVDFAVFSPHVQNK